MVDKRAGGYVRRADADSPAAKAARAKRAGKATADKRRRGEDMKKPGPGKMFEL